MCKRSLLCLPFSTCKIHYCYTDESLQSNFPFSCLDVKLFSSLWSHLRDLQGPINLRTEQDVGVSTTDAIVVDPRMKNKLHWKLVDGGRWAGFTSPGNHQQGLISCVHWCVYSDWLVPVPCCLLNILSTTFTDDCGLVPGSFKSLLPQLGSPHSDEEKRNGRGHPEMTDDSIPRRLEYTSDQVYLDVSLSFPPSVCD